ncbi:hypothetical protein DXG03_005920 [Asterophora parasitica]|uniref:Uncharacterized protein n=1 Tax=Asterophora parasitica TaxID=117018 RepID=A0A9P7KE43_9AGAR|nr:hypothetical protein DXG03_005920 [Asterophora parasitica]
MVFTLRSPTLKGNNPRIRLSRLPEDFADDDSDGASDYDETKRRMIQNHPGPYPHTYDRKIAGRLIRLGSIRAFDKRCAGDKALRRRLGTIMKYAGAQTNRLGASESESFCSVLLAVVSAEIKDAVRQASLSDMTVVMFVIPHGSYGR